VIKSRRMKWVRRGAHMGEMKNAYEIFGTKLERKRPLARLGVDGRTILEWILGKKVEGVGWMHLTRDKDQ